MSSKATSDAQPAAGADATGPAPQPPAAEAPEPDAGEAAAAPAATSDRGDEPAEAGEPAETAESGAAGQEGEPDAGEDEDHDEDVTLVSLDEDHDEDDDLIQRIEMTEPVELAEPVEDGPRRRWWPRLLIGFGFLILVAAIAGGAVAIVGSVTHGFKKPVKVTYKKSAVFSLKTGECLDPQGQKYTLIACDSPHDAEVFATFTLAGSAWPGNTTVATQASGGCGHRLTSYLNPDLAISLASTYVYPDETAWKAGTRTVICEVHAQSGQLTGSVRGAATAG